jgi:hypothetical protein
MLVGNPVNSRSTDDMDDVQSPGCQRGGPGLPSVPGTHAVFISQIQTTPVEGRETSSMMQVKFVDHRIKDHRPVQKVPRFGFEPRGCVDSTGLRKQVRGRHPGR